MTSGGPTVRPAGRSGGAAVLLPPLLAIAAALVAPGSHAQVAVGSIPRASLYVFATAGEGRAILGARDDYVRATLPLERAAKLKTHEPVDESRFLRFMESMAVDWDGAERESLAPIMAGLDRFLAGYKGKRPDRILLVQANPLLENGLPHTRANAVVFPQGFLTRSKRSAVYYMAHETFHVLTRTDETLREKLYGAIGFRRCDQVDIPEAIEKLRVTNPDAVESRHTIRVSHQGRPVDVLPYIRLSSEDIDTREGFVPHLRVAWLLVERDGGVCRARRGGQDAEGVPPEQLEGLFEQIGRNTRYLLHPEEVLADNFAYLFISTLLDKPVTLPSPEILERVRAALFD